MNSFFAYMNKEWIEGIRTHKFLIVAIGILFFAIADPIMLKLMPEILKSQFGDMDLGKIIELSQKSAMINYTKDLFQLGLMIVVLTYMGLISQEKAEKTLTIPVSTGCRIKGIVAAKLALHSIYVIILLIVGMVVAYYYAGVIFTHDFADIWIVIKGGILFGLFFTFALSLLILLGSLISKPYVAGIGTLVIVYAMSFFEGLFEGGKFLPTSLLTEAKEFDTLVTGEFYVTIAITVACMVIFSWLSVVRLKNTELV